MTRHQKVCGKISACKKCGKTFAHVKNLSRHENICKNLQCTKCSSTFPNNATLHRHEKIHNSSHPDPDKTIPSTSREPRVSTSRDGGMSTPNTSVTSDEMPSLFNCRQCPFKCKNRKEMYCHKQLQHGRGGTLQNAPWTDGTAPWIADGEIDESLREVFQVNQGHILQDNVAGRMRADYNFPTNNLSGGIGEVMNRVREVFRNENNAFRLNLAFGLILRNLRTGEYRYFIPYRNTLIFDSNIRISNIADLKALERRLQRLDLHSYILTQRNNTEWKPHCVTNMNIYIHRQQFPLGGGDLPDYIAKKKSIVTLVKNERGRRYQDNLCAFRSLAAHRQQTRIEESVAGYYNQWRCYMESEDEMIPVNSQEYKGVEYEDIPHFERCFHLQVTVCCLEPDGSVTTVHHPTTTYKDKMYLNIFEKHLSYISNFNAYSSKFKCCRCDRLFKKINYMKAHLRSCSRATKLKFPGGIYTPTPSIYEDLSNFDIHVPVADQFFEYFAVFDFEAILNKRQDRISEKSVWLTEHLPISVSICSNLPDFEDPRCFVSPDGDTLLGEMVDYLHEIADASNKLACEKWSDVLSKLEEKIQKWKPDEKSGEID